MSDQPLSLFDSLEPVPSGHCPNSPGCGHALAYHQFDHDTEESFCEYGDCRCGEATLSDPGEAHNYLQRNAHATSAAAAMANLPRSGTQRRNVLNHLIEAHPKGLDDTELVALPGTGIMARARRQELQEGGWVEWNGEYRLTQNNCKAQVWTLTAAACKELDMSTGPDTRPSPSEGTEVWWNR